ncbi:CLUMA_CG003900, isoform A [Clunio marinus]|uniref:CLUMA_CG003900, isoform A n=1 Tax=Clunio marinus TaxID=568069 RepID=A0A1J1HRN1_9DIPT|nr:CLUMA_CG003900, isoform A [Clunio marinus]
MWPEIFSVKQEKKRELKLNSDKFTELLLKSNGVLDSALFGLKQINLLQLSNSIELRAIPNEIEKLDNLQSLLLFGNHLSSLPASIEKLHKLKILDLSSNKLTEFDFDFSKMEHLSTINLSNNEISVFKLKSSIHVLDLSMNKISQFPEIPSSVTDLKMSKNHLKEIPHDMKLPNLKNLDLSENEITAVPKSLGSIKLKTFGFKNNPLKDKKLYKYIDQNQALKAIMDHISKMGLTAPLEDKEKKSNGKKENSTQEITQKNIAKLHQIIVKKANENFKIVFDPSVKETRGFILCCIVNNLQLTSSILKEFLQFQTKLHDGICKKRESATIATHDLDLIQSQSLRYSTKLKDDIMIHPLGRSKVVTASEYYNNLKSEADVIRKEKKRSQYTGIYKFLHLLDDEENFAILETDNGVVLSLPPLTNSDVSKMSANTKRMLIEVTSSVNAAICHQVMSAMLIKTFELCHSQVDGDDGKKILEIEQVRVVNIDGGLKTIFPSKVDLVDMENERTQIIRP